MSGKKNKDSTQNKQRKKGKCTSKRGRRCFACGNEGITSREILCRDCRIPLVDDYLINLNFVYAFTIIALFASMFLIFSDTMASLKDILRIEGEPDPVLKWMSLGILFIFLCVSIFKFIKIRHIALHPNCTKFVSYYLFIILGPLGLVYTIHSAWILSGKVIIGAVILSISLLLAYFNRRYIRRIYWPIIALHIIGSSLMLTVLVRLSLDMGDLGIAWFVQLSGVAIIGFPIFFAASILQSQKMDLISKTFGFFNLWILGLMINFIYFIFYFLAGEEASVSGEITILIIGTATLMMIAGLLLYSIKRAQDMKLQKNIDRMKKHIVNSYSYLEDDEIYYSLKAIDLALDHNPLTDIDDPRRVGFMEHMKRSFSSSTNADPSGLSRKQGKAILQKYTDILDLKTTSQKSGDKNKGVKEEDEKEAEEEEKVDESIKGAEFIWLKKAEIAIKNNEVEKAISYYQSAVKTNVGYSGSWLEMGNLFAAMKGLNSKAKRCHNFVLKLKSRSIKDWIKKKLPLRYVTWLVISYYFYELSLEHKRRLQNMIAKDYNLDEAEKLYGTRAYSADEKKAQVAPSSIRSSRRVHYDEIVDFTVANDNIKAVRTRRRRKKGRGRYRGAGKGKPISYREAWDDYQSGMDWEDEDVDGDFSKKKGVEWS